MLETEIYRLRFSEGELQAQALWWRPICRYLQRYVPRDGVTLDLGAGFCHFINNIESRMKIAVDINEDSLRRFAARGVRCIVASATCLDEIPDSSVDSVFASNLYEHFSSREEVAASFREVYRVLRPGGRFIVLQPNFRYCSKRYFDFFDHRLIFTHLGLIEGLRSCGFDVGTVVPRFLPYTSKSGLPSAPWLVRLYLRVRPVWRMLGAQMLLVARR